MQVPILCFAVSAVVLRRNAQGTQVLLLRRTGTLAGEWCQVAGKIEDGEKAWQAALREILEETGLRPYALYSADICEQFYEPDREAISMLPVFVAYVSDDADVVLNEEHSEFRWVSFDEGQTMVPFAGQRNVLRHVEQEFGKRDPQPLLRISANVA